MIFPNSIKTTCQHGIVRRPILRSNHLSTTNEEMMPIETFLIFSSRVPLSPTSLPVSALRFAESNCPSYQTLGKTSSHSLLPSERLSHFAIRTFEIFLFQTHWITAAISAPSISIQRPVVQLGIRRFILRTAVQTTRLWTIFSPQGRIR